jgi:formamidopyrimidine-DNA glycosylase
MPELPDVELYLHALTPRIVGRPVERIRVASPFLLRSVDPPLDQATGRIVRALHRLGKRLVLEMEERWYLVLHLMIAGRLRWREAGARIPGRLGLAALDFPNGTLLLTEAGSTKRASLYVAQGEEALRSFDPGGIEIRSATRQEFAAALRRESHTLKRALTDPHVFSGIGNAYSDEILHAARLSPLRLTSQLTEEDVARLHAAAREVLETWTARLREETGDGFPEKVTAFRPGMAVHGRFGQPCPICSSPVQRLVYAGNEANYCARCQTAGRLLADRALSRLLKKDWPRTLEELEGLKLRNVRL